MESADINKSTSPGAIAKMLLGRGLTIAVAESLTGGLLANTFAAMERASQFFLGGVVAYDREVKFNLLAVRRGPVISQRVADEMAAGVRCLFDAHLALGVTGVGGPDPAEGHRPGTVFATLDMNGAEPRRAALELSGSPGEICRAACLQCVHLVEETLGAGALREANTS